MPPQPAFDYYEALEIDRTATTEEIKNSYRRLAMIHHPDRNLGNPESTAAFQKIQLAHETLSDERSRANYDARSTRSTNHPSNGRSPFDSDSEEYDDDDSAIPDFFSFFSGGRRGFGDGIFFSQYGNVNFAFRRRRQEQEAAEAAWNKRCQEQEEAAAALRKQVAEEFQRRKANEEAQVEARAMAKAAEEMKLALAKEKREKAERADIEKAWAEHNATTQAEKQDSCLHSEFWTKEKHAKKIKCTSCSQKRGMVGYKCPHCALVVCQVCLNKINELRKAP